MKKADNWNSEKFQCFKKFDRETTKFVGALFEKKLSLIFQQTISCFFLQINYAVFEYFITQFSCFSKIVSNNLISCERKSECGLEIDKAWLDVCSVPPRPPKRPPAGARLRAAGTGAGAFLKNLRARARAEKKSPKFRPPAFYFKSALTAKK